MGPARGAWAAVLIAAVAAGVPSAATGVAQAPAKSQPARTSSALADDAPTARGVAPLWAPDRRGRMHVSGAEHVLFALPRGRWTPSTRQAGRLMYDGSYTRRLRVHGRPCTLLFGFGARRQRQRPLLRVIPGGRHARRGQHDGTRWLSWQFSLPPARQGAYARAYRAAPAGAGWRWLAVNALVEPLGRTASAGCSRAAARTDLAAVVASARIARGHLPTGS